MFGIWNKNKKKNIEKIDSFNKAIKAIKFFIATYEWQNAIESIEEIKTLEKQSYRNLNEELNNNDNILLGKEQSKQKKIFKKKLNIIRKLEILYNIEKEKYDKKIDKERFKVRFDQIKSEIDNLIHSSKAESALILLQSFLEENKNNQIVVSFFNKEKKKIQKALLREERNEAKKFKENTKLEALKLIGKTVNIENKGEDKNKEKEKIKFFEVIRIYKKIKQRLKRKKLLDEVNLLIEENSKVKDDIAKQKLETIHKGLIKEIEEENMIGYNLFGKIIGADKIVGDTFGYTENNEKQTFFIGDATGHGIRAGFIVTLLSRLFNKNAKKSSINKLVYEVNNGLKQDLKSRNFITGIFFEIIKKEKNIIKYVGAGHEPMLIYRRADKTVDTIIPGGLAAGIRIIKNEADVKDKEIEIADGDILLTYSDGITEAKSSNGEYYEINRLKDSFYKAASISSNIRIIYDSILKDVQVFKGGSKFHDDVTILLLQRDEEKDIIHNKDDFIKTLKAGTGISNTDIKKIKGTTKEEIEREIKELEKQKKTKNIVKILENLYYTGETLKLKQEAIKYIKEGYIDKKINFYLRKAINNEQQYKIDQKEQRVTNKYNVLKKLMEKGDYKTVINEAENIISKDGNI